MPPPAPDYQAPPPARLPLDDHTRMLLGRPNFARAKTAQRMRELEHKIEHRAGDEQAAVLHLNLTMYQKHGTASLENANAYLESGPAAQMGLPFWVNAIGKPVITVAAVEGRNEAPREKTWERPRRNDGKKKHP
jgi:hypothetical protein